MKHFNFKNKMANHDGTVHRFDDRSRDAAYAAQFGGRSNWDKRLASQSSPASINGNTTTTARTTATATRIRPTSVKTASPIKHVIVLIGENRGLDHTFGVYKPKGKGETISNLLSKGIVNEDGIAGPELRAGAAVLGRRPAVLLHRRSGDRQVAL